MFEESKTDLTSYIFVGLKQYIKHELKAHISSQDRILLILKISIHAFFNGTHHLQIVCSVPALRYPQRINFQLSDTPKERVPKLKSVKVWSFTIPW